MPAKAIDDLPPRGARPFTGLKALLAFVGFFAVTFSANGALVYYALSTFSGEQEASPYEHGLAYDTDIGAAREQDARRWRVSVDALRSHPGDPALIDVKMQDADDRPLQGLAVKATMEYPADKKLDRQAILSEAVPGEYRADAPLPAGQWDLVIEASRGGERLFRSRNRIVLR